MSKPFKVFVYRNLHYRNEVMYSVRNESTYDDYEDDRDDGRDEEDEE